MGVLYKLDFSSGKSYIGITRMVPPIKRFYKHDSDTRNGATGAINNAWRKYGKPNFVVLAQMPNDLLPSTEIRAIQIYGTISPGGYNITQGGESPALSQETRRKISAAQKGKKRNPCSEETKARISLANTGKKRTPEECARISASITGKPRKPMTEDHKKNISRGKIGKTKKQPPVSDETKRKLSEACKGRVISAEQRAKISKALTGRKIPLLQGVPLSHEHREKLKAAWVRRKGKNAGQVRYGNPKHE